ncbi:MAG TPA: RDD family protein, partial [Chitinophagaceae bacterium]
MAVISITTSQNIELEYDLASLGERIVATIIDLVILVGYVIIIGMFTNLSNGLDYKYGWVYLFLFLPVTFYSLLCETFLNGQSVGKKVMGVKVVSL